jgi:hypothetical protein
MKKLSILVATILLFAACGEESVVETPEESQLVEATLCNCLDTVALVDRKKCDSIYPNPIGNEEKSKRMDEAKACGVELVYQMDTIVHLDSLPEPKSIEEVLTMEVPDPLSEKCQKFLEEFAAAIKRYTKIVNKASENPDDFKMIIKLNQERSEFQEWPSKPQMFSCSDNESFKHKVEKLTEQADNLLAS